jgi:hypothetical protein
MGKRQESFLSCLLFFYRNRLDYLGMSGLWAQRTALVTMR